MKRNKWTDVVCIVQSITITTTITIADGEKKIQIITEAIVHELITHLAFVYARLTKNALILKSSSIRRFHYHIAGIYDDVSCYSSTQDSSSSSNRAVALQWNCMHMGESSAVHRTDSESAHICGDNPYFCYASTKV